MDEIHKYPKWKNVLKDFKELSALLRFSGFPEPLLSTSVRFHNKWRTDYVDRLIREDMRDLNCPIPDQGKQSVFF